MKYLSFSHVSHYIFVGVFLKFLKKQRQSFLIILSEKWSFYSIFLSVLAKNGKQMMTKP